MPVVVSAAAGGCCRCKDAGCGDGRLRDEQRGGTGGEAQGASCGEDDELGWHLSGAGKC